MSTPDTNPVQSETVVAFEGVSKEFRVGERTMRALDGVSADVKRGIVTGLVGPDGAGKTTLMRLVTGLLAPDAGSIAVLGIDVVREPLAVQATIGYMPQRFGLYEDLTVQENLDLYSDLQGVRPKDRPDRYAELMRMTGLASFTKRLAGKLSGGMKQKLGLACTLVRPPKLLLLDEPTVGVDPVSRRELWAIVYRLVQHEGMTVLLSTAYLDEAERCDEVILMHDGKLLGQGSPESFSRRVEGKSFQVTTPAMNKRALQERLVRSPGILDAIIHGGGVRMVTEKAVAPSPAEFSDVPHINIAPVQPRFEDSFVSLMKGAGATRPVSTAESAAVKTSQKEGDVIVVRDVKRRFRDFYAVKGISFTVVHGEVFGLLGANGAGKSTTFRMLCGLLPVSDGTLRVAGHDLRTAAAHARSLIGYMAQRFSLYVNLSVFENLRFFSSAYGLYGKKQRTRIDWAMDEFGLSQFADSTSGDLPLGYKQRLALAAALMHSPDILFLDEPTSGVDPLARREFWRRINSLAEQGVTVLVTTHFMEEAEYCDRLVIMDQGKILAEGTPEEIRERSRTPDYPDPTMEDAFIDLIEGAETESGAS